MSKILISFIFIYSMTLPVSALEITAPRVPASGEANMPVQTESFGDGLLELFQKALDLFMPDLKEAAQVCVSVISGVLILSLLRTLDGNVKKIAELTGAILIGTTLLLNMNVMIQLGARTIQEMSDYGKLLYPVMTTAMAAQGGISTSTAIYTGTAIFDTVLSSLISNLLIPMVYLFLALAVANSAVGEDLFKRICELIKNALSWCLKTIVIIFTSYMSITGVVSGATDTAALKAAKLTISSVVPVVGGIMSDASEAVLVSAGLLKNSAGIYGILAIIAICLDPFIRIAAHYLLLKATAAVCVVFGSKKVTGLVDDFAVAMGLLLAMTGAVCLMLLISIVCFMKGVT